MLGTHNIRGKMLGIGNTCKGNTWNRQCVWKKCSESEINAKEILGIGNVCEKLLGIGNTRKGNTWNRQCTQKERLKSQIHVKKTLGIVKN